MRGLEMELDEMDGRKARKQLESLRAAGMDVSSLTTEWDERIEAWHKVAGHPALRQCYDSEAPLIDAIVERLTQLVEIEQTVTELKAAKECIPAPRPLARDDLSVGMIGKRVRINEAENGSVEGVLSEIVVKTAKRAEYVLVTPDLHTMPTRTEPTRIEVTVAIGAAGRVTVSPDARIEVLG